MYESKIIVHDLRTVYGCTSSCQRDGCSGCMGDCDSTCSGSCANSCKGDCSGCTSSCQSSCSRYCTSGVGMQSIGI